MPDFLKQAVEDIGVYPSAVHYADGEVKQRTEWEEGWNACISAVYDRQVAFEKWYNGLSQIQQECYDTLEATDGLLLNYNTETKAVKMWLNMNDIFCPAADGEDVEPSDLPELFECWMKGAHDGLYAWVAVKRNKEPWKELRSPGYQKAKKWLLTIRALTSRGPAVECDDNKKEV
jgi:hypothetical protein